MLKELNNALQTLKQGGTLLYPTDTIWGLGCDATNYNAVESIFKIKNRDPSKALVVLVPDFKMLEQYIENVPEVAYSIIKYAIKPTTVIYDNPIRISENLVASDNTLAIRVVRSGFANALLKKFKKPIVSTSANFSGKPSPKSFSQIDKNFLKQIDYVVNLKNETMDNKPSSIIKLSNDGIVTIIRK